MIAMAANTTTGATAARSFRERGAPSHQVRILPIAA
jgi:hypothetical protein